MLQLRHICKAHNALLRWLTLQKSLNLLYFYKLFVFQFGCRLKDYATSLPTNTHKKIPKLYFAHHTVKQLLSESDGSPPCFQQDIH